MFIANPGRRASGAKIKMQSSTNPIVLSVIHMTGLEIFVRVFVGGPIAGTVVFIAFNVAFGIGLAFGLI